jgi:very-short-patch-repair endonuclease
VRRLPTGRVFLDVEWKPWGVVAEIDGAQHEEAGHRVDDALRDNEQVIGGKVVLRIPVLGLRLDQGSFLDQVERLLRGRGWTPLAEAA